MKKILLLFSVTVFTFSSCKQQSNFPIPADIPLQLNLKGNFSLDKQYETGNGKNYVFKSADDCLMISTITQQTDSSALAYRSDKLSLVNSLFTDQGTPYPGRVTNHQGCPDEYKPVELINNTEIYALRLTANDRFVYGGCTTSSATYSSALIFIYCSNAQTLYEIKYFTPFGAAKNDLKEVVKSVSCI